MGPQQFAKVIARTARTRRTYGLLFGYGNNGKTTTFLRFLEELGTKQKTKAIDNIPSKEG